MTHVDLVRALWMAIEARDWEAVESICDPDLMYSLPQSGETHGRAGYLRMNREYPGEWQVSIDHIIDGGDWVVSEVTVAFPDRRERGVSLFRCANHKIVEAREYWPEPFPVPDWRAAWRSEQG